MPNSKSLILSNVNINMIHRYLKSEYIVDAGIGYNTWLPYLLAYEDYHLSSYNNIFIILDGNDLYHEFPTIEHFTSAVSIIRQASTALPSTHFYVSTINVSLSYCVDNNVIWELQNYQMQVNQMIHNLLSSSSNLRLLDLNSMIAFHGENVFLSNKMKYISSCPFSATGCREIANRITRILSAQLSARKKCLVLDLDNTLWGGVIGEDGIDNILLSDHKEGAAYYDFQKILHQIKNTGIILAIVSKNNQEDVEPIWDTNKMFLHKDDFILIKTNWEPKYKNISDIADELNIGLDSIVFIDDNPIEREAVKNTLPMVQVPDFPEDIADLPSFGNEIFNHFFFTDIVLKEDLKKSEMYKANIQRNKLKNEAPSLDSFIKSLNITLSISEASINEVARLSQMTQKTNQFNMTTIRMSEQDVTQYITQDDKLVYRGSISDNYGDNGISLLCFLTLDSKNKVAIIDNFLMSCRVMGRNLEHNFLLEIEKELFQKGYEEIRGSIIPSGRNIPALKFYEKCNFQKLDDIVYAKRISSCYDTESLITVRRL